ncbi:hypothetical protein BGP75_25360 [Motiliproteus sp. MSK22-1]|nr:hypothetical protein BGP75_25360 [Motiliproteus sp. MSK22-1]
MSLVILNGCESGLKPFVVEKANIDVPPVWQELSHPGDLSDQGWLAEIQDSRLPDLIAEAVESNPDLQLARAKLNAGLAQVTVTGAALLPRVDGQISGARSRRSSNGSHSISNSFNAELQFSWEADLWNKLSDSERAAVLDAKALRQDLKAGRLSLAANVSKAWFAAVESKLQEELSQSLVDNLKANLEILEEGYRSGIFGALDIHLSRANLAAEQGRLAVNRQTHGDRVRSLEALMGRYPGNVLELVSDLPELPPPVPAGLPSSLLERRHDIRAADLRFERSVAELSRAHKDRFPSLRLTADYGISSDELKDLLKGNSLAWTALASLAQPLFDGGRLAALEQRAVAEAEQAKAIYINTVLGAFSDVESTLQQEQQLIKKTAALRLSSEESEYAQSLAFEQYRAGLVDYITVLEAQRRAFIARSSYLESRSQQLQNRINLYLALGGDFMTQSRGGTDLQAFETEGADSLIKMGKGKR